MSDLVDDIKVEVQLPSKEGDNLITNTSGQYGAWQWAAGNSTTGVSITGDPEARTITATRNATSGYTAIVSDYLPVTPGMYANARVDLLSITSGHKVTLALQFYDSSYGIISWQYSSPSSTLDTLAFSSVTIPAGAAWVQIFVILDKAADPLPGAGSANANASVTFTRAMLAELSSTGVPSNVTTNLVPNGGFQYVTTGWTAGTNMASVMRSTPGAGQYRLAAILVDGVTLSSAEYSYVNGPFVDIEEGENYSLRVDTYNPGQSGVHAWTTGVLYRWFDADGKVIGGDTYLTDGSTTVGWHQVWKILTAPAGAVKIRLHPFLRHHGPQAIFSDEWYLLVDSVSLVKSSVLTPYFDGDTADTSSAIYDWTGTPGNSPSTRTSVGAVDYVEPDEQFIDITGGYNQFTIERSELDVSTCNGTIVDPTLSPARADTVVVPGRGIRVSAWRPDEEAFVPLFTGRLGPCSVEYNPLNDEKRQKAKITVTSTGRESTLAQASRPGVTRTPANLGALVLAQAGVPWNVNGSTDIVGGVVTIADNENASALDQVALTRDTVSGYAWVDPSGTLQFHTGALEKSTGPSTMGAGDYTAAGLKASFSTERLINSVNIVRIIRASDGSTEERQHGPYEDGASIRRWGRSSATVAIASIPDDTAQADSRAAAILAANATPKLVIEEVAVNSADDRTHAFHDLYDLITVSADTIDGEIVADTRVTSIKHEFTTEARPNGRGQGRWRTTYGFMAEGGVASPAIQPPVASPEAVTPSLVMNKNSSALGLTANTWTVVSGWDVVTNTGFTSVAGSEVTIATPGLYFVSFTVGYNAGTSRCLTSITKNSTNGGVNQFAREDNESSAARIGHNVAAPVRCVQGDVIRGLAWSSVARNVEQNLSAMIIYRLGD